jgi:hypothetical protein
MKDHQSRDGLRQKNNSGGVQLSHAVTHAVSSALPGLTSEFEINLQILGLEAGNLGESGQHSWANFLAIMKGKYHIGPTRTGQGAV